MPVDVYDPGLLEVRPAFSRLVLLAWRALTISAASYRSSFPRLGLLLLLILPPPPRPGNRNSVLASGDSGVWERLASRYSFRETVSGHCRRYWISSWEETNNTVKLLRNNSRDEF